MGASILAHLVEPLLYLSALGYGLGYFIREIAGLSYLSFLASGIMVSSAMMTASFEAMFSAYSRLDHQRTHESLLATPLTVDDITTGEVLWASMKALISGVGILLVAMLLGAVHGWRSLLALPVIFLTGLTFAAMAMNITALARRWDFFQYYMTLTPMLLLCGVFYPVSSLPEMLQAVVAWLPLTHAIALIRPLLTGQALTDVVTHLFVLGAYLALGWYSVIVLMRKRLFV
ncbi:MAG: nodulation protein NodJ [Gammaproteobacteria bacterium]|nr:MAG: nodulation protein NodJ [Gammaproteobacteria bacterium]